MKSHLQTLLTRSNREATLAHPIFKTLAADLLRLRDILPVNVGSVMFKSRGRHSHYITIDSLHTGFQQKNFHPPINRQPIGKHTAGCACSNWIISTLNGIPLKQPSNQRLWLRLEPYPKRHHIFWVDPIKTQQ